MSLAESDLLALREQFPALASSVYMISHSLGAMPRAAQVALNEYAQLWVEKSITAWEDWIKESKLAAARIEKILGAAAGTVQMATNVSQVQATLASCLDYAGPRNRVVYTSLNFPTVSYVWKAEERRGAEVVVVPSDDGIGVPTERLLAAIDERTLVVPISHVLFRSSFIQDAAAIVKRAHEVGAMVILDTYQSAGTIPLDVTALGVDFVCGGSVKWLCGGPGAAYLYVRPDLIPRFAPRTTGWFAHRAPFAFTMPDQEYAEDVSRYGGGTLAIAPLYQARAGAELIGRIGVTAIRQKSLRQTAHMLKRAAEAGYRINSPQSESQRGGTVVMDFAGADKVCAELNRRKFFCDHRPGGGLRASPHFYTTDAEVDRFMDEVETLRRAL
ncbi:MAG TPA: aminotransferase class V-fold PLP-dependent enzyme [Pseudomonadota bacterium]|nr:aminotransferase class V-fold PLP-dependent enzyme [Pseudomonadota bacterium]